MEDLKCELEVHVRAYQHQRSLRGSELSLVTIVKFTIHIDILNCKSQFDIIDCSLGIIPSKFLL